MFNFKVNKIVLLVLLLVSVLIFAGCEDKLVNLTIKIEGSSNATIKVSRDGQEMVKTGSIVVFSNIPSGEYTLEVSKVGYVNEKRTVVLQEDTIKTIKLMFASKAVEEYGVSESKATKAKIKKSKSKEPNFREVYWGMSKEEVKKIENKKAKVDTVYKGKEVVGYDINVNKKPMTLYYYFINDKLLEAMYNIYYEDFMSATMNSLTPSLNKKYGKFTNREEIWINPKYRGVDGGILLALPKGHVALVLEWDNEKTRNKDLKITTTESKDFNSDRIQYQVHYESLSLKHLIEELEAKNEQKEEELKQQKEQKKQQEVNQNF